VAKHEELKKGSGSSEISGRRTLAAEHDVVDLLSSYPLIRIAREIEEIKQPVGSEGFRLRDKKKFNLFLPLVDPKVEASLDLQSQQELRDKIKNNLIQALDEINLDLEQELAERYDIQFIKLCLASKILDELEIKELVGVLNKDRSKNLKDQIKHVIKQTGTDISKVLFLIQGANFGLSSVFHRLKITDETQNIIKLIHKDFNAEMTRYEISQLQLKLFKYLISKINE